MTDPLLADWDTPFAIPPFGAISDDDWAPAVEAALEEARARVAGIADDPAPPTFENTVEALERADAPLSRVLGPFYVLNGADTNRDRQALARKFAPELAAYGNEVAMNRALFERIDALWARRDALGLSAEQERVLMLTRRGFVRQGALLEGAERERLGAIKVRLSELGTRFAQNLLEDEAGWSMPLSGEDMAGLPEFVRDAARAAGEERGAEGPVLTLSRSLVVPFLQFSERRDLREKAWRAWTSRGANGGGTDNRRLAAEILALRKERAALLGYGSFAEFKLETEMAGTPEAVADLLTTVWEPARARALEDQAALQAMAAGDGVNGPLEPWDWRFYSERRRRALHDLDEAEIKPYLALDAMREAAFETASRLFGLEFRELPDAPRWHPDVRVWEVSREGRHMAVFFGDWFARPSKRSGAWCTAMRSQSAMDGEVRPLVVNVCNFSKGDPALLGWDDARTLFHEFGHALHQMLSDVRYESVSGTSVARDFVELPSQLFEHWLEVPEVLERHARHVETGEPMPPALRERLLGAGTYDQGFATVEYVASALVDLAFHGPDVPEDPMERQRAVLQEIGMPRAIPMRHATPHFAHVFAGDGYSAGYYSYMWSEVMDADAFAAFEEAGGPFDADVAEALEENILSVGGSAEAADLYRRFRGRMPGPEAMLRGRGLAA
ncbi:peptidyl-dipeptidase Dcp [Hasllibacter halocynthiae]|uniref:Peptidyl-dipeptidase Dcp n=1 Tax=Hasllibacter halocynthiae TaxID=595589 RepID=A0A2T0X1Y2_9RHOB|nr:M3 family metallopeptidase [Hasllibacter halocynthiae]PRY92959.1 peptidyl-dipeptidase Dcp [Hasllibacter halocynthiae]